MRSHLQTGLCLAAFWLSIPGDCDAQLRYLPGGDTLVYSTSNNYHLYFVQDRDTLGTPSGSRSRERIAIREQGGHLEAWVELTGEGFRVATRFRVTPIGRVTHVDGRAVQEVPAARVDLFNRLPESGEAVVVGATWVDTVTAAFVRSYGETYYRATRNYHVAAMSDSAETRVALLIAEGVLSLRQGGWQDSATAVPWWQEVEGPVRDSVWFDVGRGRVLRSWTYMDLSGMGGYGPASGGVTMPSGLRSEHRRALQR